MLTSQTKVGELIRNKRTRAVWLVIGKNTQGLMVVNLMLKQDPAVVMIVLPAYSDNWQRDIEINDLDKWEKDKIEQRMPIIEEVEKAAAEEDADLLDTLERRRASSNGL